MDIREDDTAPAGAPGGESGRQPAARQTTPGWRRRGTLISCGVLAATLVVTVPTVSAAVSAGATTSATTEIAASGTVQTNPRGETESARSGPFAADPRGSASSDPQASSGLTTMTAATTADAEESTGVVIIETEIDYGSSAAAGTGLVLSSDGLVLTNNHVVEGATEISVTVADTGETYTATLVGTDDEDDVALLQLEGAADLDTVTIDDDAETVGDAVTAVGNADGGGVLMAADGSITALEASVTTSETQGSASETLDGMIEIVADVVSGDSGGALLDAEGEVIGVTTAASTGSATTVAYAIPIEDALDIVQLILDGDESDGVTIGYPAFLGVQMADAAASAAGYGPRGGFGPGSSDPQSSDVTGATIAGVIEGTPAAEAGLAAGDTITAIDGEAVTDTTDLSDALADEDPGDTVTIEWVDSAGSSHSASVTLIEGPVA